MRRSIPVSIGYHSGLTPLPDAMIEFKDDEIQQALINSMVDGTEFMLSFSATRKLDGSLVLQEIRFIPELSIRKKESLDE